MQPEYVISLFLRITCATPALVRSRAGDRSLCSSAVFRVQAKIAVGIIRIGHRKTDHEDQHQRTKSDCTFYAEQ